MSFDFAAVVSPFRMQPGLRRLADGDPQLTPNRPGERALTEKLGVLRTRWPEALLQVDGGHAAPLLRALSAHAATEHPHAFAWDGAQRWDALLLGWSLQGDTVLGEGPAAIGECLRALPSEWRLTGLLALAFAEDFALIDATTGTIPWLAVCLPSHWSPADKLGRHFAEVHAPVADNQTLIAAGDHLMRLVTGTQRWERFVWTITRHAGLQQHPRHLGAPPWRAAASADEIAALAFFRTERQSFIPMPDHAQAIFTIHIESQPLAEAITQPAHAQALHAALASMSESVLAYRGLTEVRDRLLSWLA
jgi:hypothetical protein